MGHLSATSARYLCLHLQGKTAVVIGFGRSFGILLQDQPKRFVSAITKSAKTTLV
jgi:hypothetical protein